jgi:hypothetical protein
MVLEPHNDSTLPPIFSQSVPFLESLILKFNQTDGWYLFLLCKFPLFKARLFASVTSNLHTHTGEKSLPMFSMAQNTSQLDLFLS